METYGLILDLLGLASLESGAVALVLETLRSHKTLDLGSLGVGLLALALGLDLAANDVLANLFIVGWLISFFISILVLDCRLPSSS